MQVARHPSLSDYLASLLEREVRRKPKRKIRFGSDFKFRVSIDTKRRIEQIAEARGTHVSCVLREAILNKLREDEAACGLSN